LKAQISLAMLVTALISLLFIGMVYQAISALASNTTGTINASEIYAIVSGLKGMQ
jgi:uncharacterized protein (UPF0333 family)